MEVKARTFRAIVIDPERHSIEETQLPANGGALRALIPRDEDEGLDHFLLAEFDHSWDDAWVRDCGLVNGKPIHAVKFLGRHDPVAGRIVILGVDKESRETCDACFALTTLHGVIDWLGLIKPETTWVQEESGARCVVTYERVG